jgi:hypothetical protein
MIRRPYLRPAVVSNLESVISVARVALISLPDGEKRSRVKGGLLYLERLVQWHGERQRARRDGKGSTGGDS